MLIITLILSKDSDYVNGLNNFLELMSCSVYPKVQ